MKNRYPSPALLAEIRRLRADLAEDECRRRAERMAYQRSEEGRAEMVARLRKSMVLPIR